MKRQLQFDAGNTRLKWRLIHNEEVIDVGSIDNNQDWLQALAALFDACGQVDLVLVSSVTGDEHLGYLVTTAQKMTSAELVVARTIKTFAGITVAYEQPQRLGVDRWLAMLAAHEENPDSLKVIVDCGTAITLDVVDHDGQHQGGYIIPGIRLMKESLAINTAGLYKVEHPAEALALGRQTVDCINHGVLAMSVSLIEKVCGLYPEALLVMTGGDAGLVLPHLNTTGGVVVRPDLVMDGLTVVGRSQEK